jgi:hypothetical protein
MISDVLSEALSEIERYQTDPVTAAVYADAEMKAKIAAATTAMRALLDDLDTAPPSADEGA